MRIAYYEDADNQTGRTIREVHHVTAYSGRYLIADDLAFDFGEAESELTVALNQLLFEGYYNAASALYNGWHIRCYPKKDIIS